MTRTSSFKLPVKQASFQFFGDLRDFLPKSKKGVFPCSFRGNQSVKHLVESFGIPHTEVGLILRDGERVGFDYLVQEGDEIWVYSISEQIRETNTGIPGKPPGETCFIVDNHLGRLAVYLRMLGFDVLYQNDYQDGDLADLSDRDERILLTRDRRLLMRNSVHYGYSVRSKIPTQQLVEVLRRYCLLDQISPFRRCMRCNGLLKPVSKEEILHRLQPLTKKYFDEFCICTECDKIYWRGSHYERMVRLINQVINANAY